MRIERELPEIFEEFGEQRKTAFLEIKEFKDRGIPVVPFCRSRDIISTEKIGLKGMVQLRVISLILQNQLLNRVVPKVSFFKNEGRLAAVLRGLWKCLYIYEERDEIFVLLYQLREQDVSLIYKYCFCSS